jgi:hypothetical protein
MNDPLAANRNSAKVAVWKLKSSSRRMTGRGEAPYGFVIRYHMTWSHAFT